MRPLTTSGKDKVKNCYQNVVENCVALTLFRQRFKYLVPR